MIYGINFGKFCKAQIIRLTNLYCSISEKDKKLLSYLSFQNIIHDLEKCSIPLRNKTGGWERIQKLIYGNKKFGIVFE